MHKWKLWFVAHWSWGQRGNYDFGSPLGDWKLILNEERWYLDYENKLSHWDNTNKNFEFVRQIPKPLFFEAVKDLLPSPDDKYLIPPAEIPGDNAAYWFDPADFGERLPEMMSVLNRYFPDAFKI